MAEKSSRSASSTSTTTANVGKLYRLLFDGGTKAVKIQLEKHFTPFPSKLVNFLETNPGKIQELVERRVINSDQLNQLRPDDGSDPDPEKFDISLTILILTNFCGLRPPRLGWDKMPHKRERSLSAKLVRLKLFRNNLVHRPNTHFEDKEFLNLWESLRGILCSLGLPSSDIEKFRRLEDCDEKYYFELLKKWADSEEDSNRKFKAIYENQVKAQQTLQDTNQTVLLVRQNQMEASKLQQVDHKTLEHTHQVAEGLQRSVEQVLRTQQETQQQIKDVAADAKEKRDKGNEDEALSKLAKVNTERVIQYHSGKYQEGTRLRIIERINLWLDDRTSENRVMVISGDAGMGKSVISAVVCQQMRHAGRLSGSHFCQHNKTRDRNPKIMLQSLAYQLSEFLPPYKRELVKALSRNLGEDINKLEVGELFELLFEEPLINIDDPGRSLLMMIDGLDESEYKGRNELLDVIANHFSTLPGWVRFCVTTRPEINIVDCLKKFNPVLLEQDDEENVKDIRLFLERQLCSVIPSGSEELVVGALVRKAAGNFLYAYLMVDFIKKNVSLLTPEELGRTLPSGLSSVYQSYFERLEKELTISEEVFLTFLSALAAAKEPLPLDFVSKMLLSDIKSPAGHRKVRKAIECISSLLPVQDGCIHFFHKSVKDWLTDGAPDMYGVQHKFYVNEDQGHRALSQLCVDELDDVKRKSVHGTDFSDAAKYALQYGVGHMLELEESTRASGRFEEIINNYVTDLDIVYAKLCVHNAVNSEDIVRVQERETFKSLSDESQRALSTLFSLLRKYHRRLSTHPSTIFQVMVNEGGDIFAGEATKVLQSLEIPYMEYLHEEALKELNKTQAEFPCNSVVVCFDISPTQEFMVCECWDGMIYLWSLKTGEQRWVRRTQFKKCYSEGFLPFRVVPNSDVYSCYRSVVFHPTETIVLPGILSHAYSFKGNLQPLFPKSNCRFSVCSVHGDESKIITDCPGDAKCLVMWNLKNGEEITRTIRNEDVLSFAWSPDGTLVAISHFSGLVCLVDALNSLDTTLAEVTTKQPCGMIKFTPDVQFLFCLSWPIPSSKDKRNELQTLSFPLNVIKLPCGTFSLNVLDNAFGQDPWNSESSSKGGFLMGDPMFYRIFSCGLLDELFAFAFVLNKQSVLRVPPGKEKITMLKHEDYSWSTWRFPFFCIAFALDGKTIYGTTERDEGLQVVSLDVSSGDRKAEIVISADDVILVPVLEGVLLKECEPGADVQLWNFELSQQIRSWPNLSEVRDIMPVSDQCVACVGRDSEVSILDTSNGNIVKTIPVCLEGFHSSFWLRQALVVFNSKYQLLSATCSSVQLSDGKNELWKTTPELSSVFSPSLPKMFSPTEEFVLVCSHIGVVVLEASSGKHLRTLCTVGFIVDFAFVSKTECVIVRMNTSGSYCLLLFNVSTGDLLTVLDIDFVPSQYLASCPQKGLIAIGLEDSECMCAVIQVKQLRDKVNQEAKERSSDDDDDHFQSKKEDDENKDDEGDEFHDNDDSHNSDDVEVAGDDVGDDNGGGDEITEEQELLQQIQELSLEGRVEDLDESDSDKIKIHEGTITSEGTHWALKRGSAHVFFPPNAVSQPTSIVAHRWKFSARSPPLQEHESVVSNVIEISTTSGDELKFDAKVKLVLSHSAPDLRGYELVIKKLIDWESNEWEEVDGTKALQCLKAVEEDFPPHPRDVPEFFFPVAQADITECSTYAVVCRLKPSPAYAITSSGGSFSHPDYPRVTVTIPENAVTPEAKIPLVLKVQEVPGEEFKDQDVFLGPILRVSCSQIVEFSKPVTIQLPVSLRSDQERIPGPSKCRVRVLFLNSNGEDKKWMEITDGLKCPVNFDGTFVRFQVERFSGYTCVFEWYKEYFSVSGVITYLTSLIWKQPLLGVFFSYFNELDRAYSQDVLHLICCPAHMRERVVQELENANVVPSEENSRKKLIPGHDKAFVFVSGGITPAEIEDMEDFHLMFESDNRDKKQLPVRLISDQVLSHVEFRSSPDPNAKNLLSRLNFRLSSMKLDLTKTPVEFFGVLLNDQTLLDADPKYVLSACRPFLSNDAYQEHFNHLNSGYRTPKQALMSLLQAVAGLDPNSQDECFEAVVSALREASNEEFLHVIERLQKARQKVNIALVERTEVINKVSEKVCSSWKRLARELELRPGQIDNISEEEQDDEERCHETLRTWCQLNGRNGTIRKLMISLTKIGKAEVNYDVMRCLHLVEPD